MQNLLIFARKYYVEKDKTATNFAHTCNYMAESETTSADSANAFSIFSSFKSSLETELGLDLKKLMGFCSDRASVMMGKKIMV